MANTRNVKWYGWRPDLPDHRDKVYAAPRHVLRTLPPQVDLRPQMPPVYDQGNLGSCTANAIGAAVQFCRMKENIDHATIMPSRLFLYYNERAMEGTVREDSGAQIRDGIKSINVQGLCAANYWAYVIKKFAIKPPTSAYNEAKKHPSVQYQRVVQEVSQIKAVLASGFPVVFGFTVYDSFESQATATTGIVHIPKTGESILGGHAVLCVGYLPTGQWVVRNSWGADWGLKGYFLMDQQYLLNNNLSDDFWSVSLVK